MFILRMIAIFCLHHFELKAQAENIHDHTPQESRLTFSPIYTIFSIGEKQSTIQLNDGSVWEVNLYDQDLIGYWKDHQAVSIRQNNRRFSTSPYKLTNLDNRMSVEIKLREGPKTSGEGAHHITNINFATYSITLSNGSFWQIHPQDRQTVKEWDLTNFFPVIIAGNSEFNPAGNLEWEQILIDVNVPTRFIQVHQVF